ncbi:MAG: hypothetical protein JOY83_00095 [Alphaproteobacteria bacterium]|nr:hypothetical protein [Alphaproteobacteria bacterium]
MTFVIRIAGTAALGTAMVIGSSLFAPSARAGYTVLLAQEGSNVVAAGFGTLDLAGLEAPQKVLGNAFVFPNGGSIGTGPAIFVNVDEYDGHITGPTNFGNGFLTEADSGNGDFVAISDVLPALVVPEGYVSGNPLSDTSTYDNATLSSLGITPGIYEWTWGANPDQSFTLVSAVGAAVPEPSGLSQLGVGLAGLALAGIWRRRRRT